LSVSLAANDFVQNPSKYQLGVSQFSTSKKAGRLTSEDARLLAKSGSNIVTRALAGMSYKARFTPRTGGTQAVL